MRASEEGWAKVLGVLARSDLFLTTLTLTLWLLLSVADWRVMVGLGIIRVITWVAVARALLQPVLTWDTSYDDARLVALEQRMQPAGARFMRVYASGWTALMLLTTAHGGLSGEVGRAELLLSIVMIVVVTVAITTLISGIVQANLTELHLELAKAIYERGLRPSRPPSSMARRLALNLTGLLFVIFIAVGTGAGVLHVRQERQHTLELCQQAVEVAARLSDPSPDALALLEVERVDPDELPVELGPPGDTMLTAIDPGGERVLAATALADGRWALRAATPDEDLEWIFALLMGMTVISLIRGFTHGRSLAKTFTAPFANIDLEFSGLVDRGELAGRARVTTLHDDEHGRLADTFNRLLDLLGELTVAANAVTAGDLRVGLARPGDLHDAFRGMLGRLRELVGQIQRTTLELSSTASELLAVTARQEQDASAQAERIEGVSQTVATLAAAAAEVSETASYLRGNAELSAARTTGLAEQIGELGHQAVGIAELLELIREVADRSDLLALNGALEATRAGEAGRGFAIVASEMRRLAERVNGAVDHVSTRLENIERARAGALVATEASIELARETSDAARTISAVTATQSENTRRVASTIDETSAGLNATAAGLAQTRAVAETLRHEAGELDALIQQFDLD